MTKAFLAFCLVLGTGAARAESTMECTPEIGDGQEVIRLAFDWTANKARIFVNGSAVDVCGKGSVRGEFVDYGQATVEIKCASGKVTVEQDYDETVLDVGSLSLGLSDTRFMCY